MGSAVESRVSKLLRDRELFREACYIDGRWVAGDADSYRYLAESIRVHPDQETLKALMKTAGFGHVDVHNLSAGVVALHVGIKC